VLATKCGIIRTQDDFIKDLKPESVMKEIDDSLRRLKTDYIDLYQLHWPDPNTPIEDTLEAIMKIKQAGKFRYLGVSNFSTKQMDELRKITGIVSLQPQYSMLERGIEKNIVSYCQENGLGIISYGTLAGGLLTGKFKTIPTFKEGDFRGQFYDYFHEPEWSKVQKIIKVLKSVARDHNKTIAQVAINWTFSQLGITSVLVGAKNGKQSRENAEACSFTLSLDDLQKINKAIRENLD
jgi:aryl-alcohol dehydrogenase-like predicted oxidoreductase